MNHNIGKWKWGVMAVVTASWIAGGSSAAHGSGFALLEQSAKELGSAYAGGAAAAEDASTIYFNPAGLVLIPGGQLVGAAHGIFPVAHFRNDNSRHVTGAPLTGDNDDGGQMVPVAALFYSRQVSDRLHLGIGLYSPFGLSTNYDPSWVGRYHAVKSELVTLNINPAIAYRVNDHLSLGAGVDVQYAKAKLSSAIDFGTIFGAAGLPGYTPQGNDGMVTMKGDSWGVGFNLGMLYQFTPGTRVGITYRSRIDHTLKGSADFSGTPSVNPSGRFVASGVKADVTLPDSASFSVWHNITKDFAVTTDFTWTDWSTFDELRIRFDNPSERDAVTTTSWHNTWRYSLGLIYAPGPWTVRAGTAYDQTPVPSAQYRTPRIPDNDRFWASFGFGYKFGDDLAVDVGYTHIFVNDPRISKPLDEENRLRGALNGSYTARVDLVGLQLAWNFR
ncbi:outer membrane protein transport protein [Geomonas sp. RF6]|uniref:OmpP1/FadL family transporter n=1 Tax=Geomonas sp. RF6 TaxID=2897342 RepID=UPI001E3BA5FC|nr:outer membrane protein transport protein [Geomonas sp. RF6]UFS72517.1 outer membrane protein transport protein [Geomonas sp. RF6]